jgi:hypothetical protein
MTSAPLTIRRLEREGVRAASGAALFGPPMPGAAVAAL